MNEVELRWYNTLSQQRTPEGYRHCTDCDSQRPVRFFKGKRRSCVDCVPVTCPTCKKKVLPREIRNHCKPARTRRNNLVVDGKKFCKGCKETKDSREGFYQDGGTPKSLCKECFNQKRSTNRGPAKSKTLPVSKQCTDCGEIKDSSWFYRHGDGLRGRCIPCYNKERGIVNPSNRRQPRVKYRNKNLVGTLDTLENVLVLPNELSLPSSVFDTHKTRRQRYLDNAPSEQYDRLDIFERDDWTCQLCGLVIDRDTEDPRFRATVDHIVPVISQDFWKHGDVMSNLQTAHGWCNGLKSNKVGVTPEHFPGAKHRHNGTP